MARPTLNPGAIRKDLVTRLRGRTDAGARVFDSRDVLFESDELPAISVSTFSGRDEKWSMGSATSKHTDRIAIVGNVISDVDGADLAEQMDTIESQIMDGLAGDGEWMGAFEGMPSFETARRVSETGDLIGQVAVMVDVTYSMTYSLTTTTMPFERVAIDTQPTNPDGANVSERLVELEQEDE